MFYISLRELWTAKFELLFSITNIPIYFLALSLKSVGIVGIKVFLPTAKYFDFH